VKIQHTQPGKGGAYMQVELKNLIDGRKNNVRFRSAETVERVRLDTKDFQFLFADGDMLTFMDKESYEQISLPKDLLGDAAAFTGVSRYSARVKCALLGWVAMSDALILSGARTQEDA